MSEAEQLPDVTDRDLHRVLEAERAVLVLTRTGCGYCAGYEEEILDLLRRGQLRGIAIGKVTLDRPGVTSFKRENPWLRSLEFLPYTVLYRRGEKVDEFAASKSSYLLERIEATL